MQRRTVFMFSAKTHFWLMVSSVTTRTPRTFSARLLFIWEASSMYRYLGLFLLSCSTFCCMKTSSLGGAAAFKTLVLKDLLGSSKGKPNLSLRYWRLFVLVHIHLGSFLYNLLDTLLCLLAVLWELCSCPRSLIDPLALAKRVLDTPHTVAGGS